MLHMSVRVSQWNHEECSILNFFFPCYFVSWYKKSFGVVKCREYELRKKREYFERGRAHHTYMNILR